MKKNSFGIGERNWYKLIFSHWIFRATTFSVGLVQETVHQYEHKAMIEHPHILLLVVSGFLCMSARNLA